MGVKGGFGGMYDISQAPRGAYPPAGLCGPHHSGLCTPVQRDVRRRPWQLRSQLLRPKSNQANSLDSAAAAIHWNRVGTSLLPVRTCDAFAPAAPPAPPPPQKPIGPLDLSQRLLQAAEGAKGDEW